jgi:hypothetical protein
MRWLLGLLGLAGCAETTALPEQFPISMNPICIVFCDSRTTAISGADVQGVASYSEGAITATTTETVGR